MQIKLELPEGLVNEYKMRTKALHCMRQWMSDLRWMDEWVCLFVRICQWERAMEGKGMEWNH